MIWLLLQVSLLVVVLGAGSTLALYRWSSEPGPSIEIMLWAGLVCLAATVVSVLPLAVAVRRAKAYLMQACLAGTTIRLILNDRLVIISPVSYACQKKPGTHCAGLFLLPDC